MADPLDWSSDGGFPSAPTFLKIDTRKGASKMRFRLILTLLSVAILACSVAEACPSKRSRAGKKHCFAGQKSMASVVVTYRGPFCDNPVNCPSQQSIISGVLMTQESFGDHQASYFIQNDTDVNVIVYPARIVKSRSICESQTCYQAFALRPHEKQKVGEGNDLFTAAHDGVSWAIVHSRAN